MTRSQRLVPLLAALGLYGMSMAGGLVMPRPVQARTQGAMELKLRRSQDSIEVVIEGVGPQPVLQQRQSGQSWEGQLRTQGTPGLRRGPQQVSMPEFGLQSVSLSGSGESYQLKVEGVAGRPMLEPVVSADGRNLILTFSGLAGPTVQTGRLDLQTPGRVPQAEYVPPLRQRAVAPPLGDMAVGTMVLSNRSFVQVSGPPVTLTLNNAPAKDALMSIARLGGYGFIYVGEELDDSGDRRTDTATESRTGSEGDRRMNSSTQTSNIKAVRKVSLSFQNDNYALAINGILLASGLQGKLEGRTLLVGRSVASKTFAPQVSKIYRLNQASASSAADYLASLGASISKVNTTTITSGEPASSGTSQLSNQISQERSTLTEIETYGASVGPLNGLTGTSDLRLNTITLVGDSQLVVVAESYLKQIDLRQRQVALSVKILDVTLGNNAAISNSFAFRYGNNFIVSDRGELVGAFGNLLPPNINNYQVMSGDADSAKPERVTLEENSSSVIQPPLNPAPVNPGIAYPKDNFFDSFKALITSKSTKTLASPTLILSESPEELNGGAEVSASVVDALNKATIGRPRANESFITVGTQEVVSYNVQAGQNGAPNTCQPKFGTRGLTFGARVLKIDDNGFVTFTLSPSISASTGVQQSVEGCGNITTLSVRRLDTGSLRVRDGQTLILTGVISDADSQEVRKWPILGDLPFIGQFFRQTSGNRAKQELVIMVTPRIINDDHGGAYGYGYRPSTDAARNLIYNRN